MAGGDSTPLLGNSNNSKGYALKSVFSSVTGITILIFLVLFFIFVKYSTGDVGSEYMWYIHVAIMIWVGFGFLMTFLHRYSLGAVSLNFFSSCVITLEAVLILGAFYYSQEDHNAGEHLEVKLDIGLLIQGLFAAGAGMISFGAVLGKISPCQLLLLMILEVPFYAVNAYLLIDRTFGARDVGGSMGIHAFGAYFGLAATLFLSQRGTGSEHIRNTSAYLNDVTSMIGTIFLWIFWPSFNAAVAFDGLRYVAIVNTVVSLLGACITTFFMSALLEGKLNMVHIQNATLAGGVAVGSSADLVGTSPGGALLIGTCAAILSVVGFTYISPALEKCIGLKDTCGVHNLHGMPGILGAVASAFVLASGNCEGSCDRDWEGFAYQLLALLVTLGIAIFGGTVSGYSVSLVDAVNGGDAVDYAFNDEAAFSVEV